MWYDTFSRSELCILQHMVSYRKRLNIFKNEFHCSVKLCFIEFEMNVDHQLKVEYQLLNGQIICKSTYLQRYFQGHSWRSLLDRKWKLDLSDWGVSNIRKSYKVRYFLHRGLLKKCTLTDCPYLGVVKWITYRKRIISNDLFVCGYCLWPRPFRWGDGGATAKVKIRWPHCPGDGAANRAYIDCESHWHPQRWIR